MKVNELLEITMQRGGLKVQNKCMSIRVNLVIAHGRETDDVKK